MSRELQGYRDELEQLLQYTNGRHLISVSELAQYDLGSTEKHKTAYIRRIYGIESSRKYIPIGEIARKRVTM